jgi:hypothetical protein
VRKTDIASTKSAGESPRDRHEEETAKTSSDGTSWLRTASRLPSGRGGPGVGIEAGTTADARRTAQYFSSGCLAIRPMAEMVK